MEFEYSSENGIRVFEREWKLEYLSKTRIGEIRIEYSSKIGMELNH